jgi:NDP-sugar pyrophosphorylase family protein
VDRNNQVPIRRAFIWAAGLGTRLRPYTNETPKPLLQIGGRPIIEYILRYLAHAGIRDVTVNTWHLAEQFEVLPALASSFGVSVTLSRQPQRFEHAGDLGYARGFLDDLSPDERFVALNGDTLFDLNPDYLWEAASRVSQSTPLAILVHDHGANPLREQNGRLHSIGHVNYAKGKAGRKVWDDFGVKVFHASVRELLPPEPGTMSLHGERGLIGSIAAAGKSVALIPVSNAMRVEIGTVEDYESRGQNLIVSELSASLANLPGVSGPVT